jgi:hypothetical protein
MRRPKGQKIDDAIRPSVSEIFQFIDYVIDRRSLFAVAVPLQQPDDVLEQQPRHPSRLEQAKHVRDGTRGAAELESGSLEILAAAVVARKPSDDAVDVFEHEREHHRHVIEQRDARKARREDLLAVGVALYHELYAVAGLLETEIEASDSGE